MSHDQTRRSTHQQYDALPDDFGEGIADHEPWPGRLPTSSRRYDRTLVPLSGSAIVPAYHRQQVLPSPIPARRSAGPSSAGQPNGQATASERRRGLFRAHPLLWLGFGMLVMLLLWEGLQALGSWWSVHQDDVAYGRPRTMQYDVVVGHQDSPAHPTHLIALNLHGTIEIIELPGGDVSHAHIYQGPHLFGPAADLVPVTLSFPDPSGDGYPDMDVHVQGQVIIYLNQHGQFVLQGPSQ